MRISQIIEGWKNNLFPAEEEKEVINMVSEQRTNICLSCKEHSSNKKNYKTIRLDAHCTNCGCTLAAKTKCLSCNCPLNKWTAITKNNKDEETIHA